MSRSVYIVPIFLCLLYGASGLPRVDPLVDSNVGLIRGLAAPDGDYSMFMGIPYANVDPLNPFGQAIPHPGFEDIFDAVEDSADCVQRDEVTSVIGGSLDCLRLNVYVPNTATTRNPLPVFVYIHGGGFYLGSGARPTNGPKFLVRHDVIVITINYRLGAFGFLCSDIPEVPGNQGLKDQWIALRWIKNNIGAFGGDINKITIAGESAGSVSVEFHLMFSQENLFNNAIMESGTTLAPFSIRDSDPVGPIRLAAYLGFNTDDVYEALEYLGSVDPRLVIEATEETGVSVRPCVEREYENVERFISRHPSFVDVPNARSIPILIGFNSREQGQMYNVDIFQWDPLAAVPLIFDFEPEYLEEMLTRMLQFYIGDEDISEEVREQITDLSSDFTFYYPTYRSIQKYLESGAPKIYHYMFSYVGGRNMLKVPNNITEISGALHLDELGYLFDVISLPDTPSPEDQLIVDRMTTLWTNFVKYSDPTPEVSDLLPVQWPSVTNENLFYLNIGSELSVQRRPFHERMAFWELFFRLNRQFLKGYNDN